MVKTRYLVKPIAEDLKAKMVFVVNWVKKVEGVDSYDELVSYNPFLIKQI